MLHFAAFRELLEEAGGAAEMDFLAQHAQWREYEHGSVVAQAGTPCVELILPLTGTLVVQPDVVQIRSGLKKSSE